MRNLQWSDSVLVTFNALLYFLLPHVVALYFIVDAPVVDFITVVAEAHAG